MGKKSKNIEPEPEVVQEAPPTPQIVSPSPVQTTFQISEVTDESERRCVRLSIFTATGQAVYFLDPQVAQAVGETLINKAALVSTN